MNLRQIFAVLTFVVAIGGPVDGNDICSQAGCSCTRDEKSGNLNHVDCKCHDKQILNIGPLLANGERAKHNAMVLPMEAVSLTLRGCHHVEIFGRSFNHLPHLKTVEIQDLQKLVLHTRMFESRGATKTSFNVESLRIENVRDLKVSSHAFEGIHIGGAFTLKNTTIQRLNALAVSPDFVGSLSIVNVNFERVPMWGIKIKHCNEANIIEGTYFGSLASGAIFLICQRVVIAGSTFGVLQDASFHIQFTAVHFYNNMFESLLGKPFTALQVNHEMNATEVSIEFKENRFVTLPVNSLAFPGFSSIRENPNNKVHVKDNHFVCQCGRIDWFLGVVGYGLDVETTSSIDFLQLLYNTAGDCLNCDGADCRLESKSFSEFASSVHLEKSSNGLLKCFTGKPRIFETTSSPLVLDRGAVSIKSSVNILAPSLLLLIALFTTLFLFQ